MIELERVGKTFGKPGPSAVRALEDVSFAVGAGEFVSVVGPSGCGKSTILRLVAGLTQPSAGTIKLDGQQVREPNPHVGIAFQRPVLLRWRTVLQNVMLPADILGLDRRKHRERAQRLLEMAGLAGFESHRPYELSGGMQQRVALCRALSFDPAVLLMDEPFAALDAITREELTAELQQIWEADRKTVVFITHSVPEAVFLSQRILVMTPRPGRIAEVVDVPLPRPRTLDMQYGDAFGAIARRVRDMIGVRPGTGADEGRTRERT